MTEELNSEEEYEDDDGSVAERIVDNGECVFVHDWDSGGLGAGAGSESVYQLGDQFAIGSSDDGPSGPYASFEEALAKGSFLWISATTAIWSSLMSAEEIATRLTGCEDDQYQVELNGETWIYLKDDQQFRRSED